MSGHLECPACHQRIVYQADGVTVALRDPACTHRAGCVERNKLVAGLLHDAGPVLEKMYGEAAQAARARNARIHDTQLAVLAAVRKWAACGPTVVDDINALAVAAQEMIEAEREGT